MAKTLTVADCNVELFMEPDDTPLEGNLSCLDDERDAENIAYVRDQLESGNDWAWCQVEVRLTYRGLTASDYLCGCSYASEDDFRKDGYFEDMVSTCLGRLQSQIDGICKECC